MLRQAILLVVLAVTASSTDEEVYTLDRNQLQAILQQQQQYYNEKDLEEFQRSMRLFSASLFHKVSQEKKEENILFSPLSISHAMGMLNSGAGGNTTKQIKQALHINPDKANAFVNALMQRTTEDKFAPNTDDVVKTVMAARTFYAPLYTMKKTYISSLQEHYHSGLEKISFTKADLATKRVNKWVEENTNNMIKDLVSSDMFTPLTRMVLVNALYFKGEWLKGFKMTTDQEIFNAPSGKIKMLFMKGDFVYKLHKTDNHIHIAIPYKDNRTELVINMPRNETAMRALMNTSALAKYFETITERKWTERKIKLFMPPFEIEKRKKVETVLKSMGVEDLFSENKADLSGMSEEYVYVSDFVHKAKIIVDKEGTEAAAASAAGTRQRIGSSLVTPSVHINKPFIFTVLQDGNILFTGRLVNPAA